jgi:pimeloyl-ACP methyl ester carboxylesterase
MPFVHLEDIRLYYEVLGQGPPLVMLMGLRGDHTWFYRQIPELARHFKLIMVDNRGVGKSGKSDKPFRIAGMAEDIVNLMDELRLTSAHFLGVSMGGCIAQEVAIRFSRRVCSLVLACTTCGGTKASAPPEHIMQWYADPGGLSRHDFLLRSLGIYFSDHWLEEEGGKVEDFMGIALKSDPPEFVLRRQMKAMGEFAAAKRLSALTQPALIVTGSDDSLIPAENAMILAGLIPDSSLLVFPRGRHCFFIEMASRFNKEITSFLHQVDRAWP